MPPLPGGKRHQIPGGGGGLKLWFDWYVMQNQNFIHSRTKEYMDWHFSWKSQVDIPLIDLCCICVHKLWKSWSTCTVSLKFQGQPFLPTLLHPFILWSASDYWYKNTLSTGYRFFWHFEQKYGMYCFTCNWYPIFQTCDNPDLMPMQLWPKLISLWFLVTCSVVLPLVTQLSITC